MPPSAAQPNSPTRRLYVACLLANTAGILVGIQLAIFSGLTEMPSFALALKPDELSATTKSFITSAYIAGAIVGALPAGPICDQLGRRPALLLTALIFLLSSLAMLRPPTVISLVVARLAAGFGYAIANIVCPMYSAELSMPSVRALFVNMYQVAITLGIFLAQIVNWNYSQTPLWIRPLQVAVVPALFMLCTASILVPESPTWLQAKGRSMEALSVSHGLGIATTATPEAPAERSEDDEERGEPPAAPRGSPSFVSMLRDASARRRLLIGAGVQMSQQLTGINAVIFFGPALVADLLKMSGSSAPFLAASIVGAVNVAAGLASMTVIERVGRRALLLFASVPMMVSLCVLGGMREGAVASSAVQGVGALLVYICAFAVAWGPLPFVVSSEIFPVQYKGMAMSSCSLLMSCCSLGVGMTFLPMLESLGGWVYVVYACCVLCASVFIMVFVPETRNLSLADIDKLLE